MFDSKSLDQKKMIFILIFKDSPKSNVWNYQMAAGVAIQKLMETTDNIHYKLVPVCQEFIEKTLEHENEKLKDAAILVLGSSVCEHGNLALGKSLESVLFIIIIISSYLFFFLFFKKNNPVSCRPCRSGTAS